MRHHIDLHLEHLPPYSNANVSVEVGKPNAEKGEDVDARYCMTLGYLVIACDSKDQEKPRSRTFELFTCYTGIHISMESSGC